MDTIHVKIATHKSKNITVKRGMTQKKLLGYIHEITIYHENSIS